MNNQPHSRFYTAPLFCIVPNCKGRQFSRGLCQACSKARQRAIVTGKTTEEELMKAGLLLPNKLTGKHGRFLRAMEKAIPATARLSKFDAAVESAATIAPPAPQQPAESTAYELPCSL